MGSADIYSVIKFAMHKKELRDRGYRQKTANRKRNKMARASRKKNR